MTLFPSTSNFRLVGAYFLSKNAVFTKKRFFETGSSSFLRIEKIINKKDST